MVGLADVLCQQVDFGTIRKNPEVAEEALADGLEKIKPWAGTAT